MSTRITRSMTSSGHGARHHLLGIPAEVRSIIIKKLIVAPKCVVKEDGYLQYSGACLPLLQVCRTLRREAIFILGRSLRLTISNVSLPRVKQSLPLGLWDHLRDIAYVSAPTLAELESLKELKGLEFVTWEPVDTPLGVELGDNLELPAAVDPHKWTEELEMFVLGLPEARFHLGNVETSFFELYYDLELPFHLAMYLPLFPAVVHPENPWIDGFIDLAVVIDLTLWMVIMHNGTLIYHWPGRVMKPETGHDIEWNGEWI